METASEVTVYMVEDSIHMRDQIMDLLAATPGIRVVGWAAGATEAVEKIRAERPAVTLLDLCLAEGSGLDVMRAVSAESLRTRIIVFANNMTAAHRRIALRSGAHDVLDKATDAARLPQAIRALGSIT